MIKSAYYEDRRKEELFGEWLDKCFYSRLSNYYKKIVRISDRSLQKKGVDVVINDSNGKSIYVDEKATLDYLNMDIPTFAFEIRNQTSGREGWLYNKNLITDYYLLAWPNAKSNIINTIDDFTDAKIMVIKRDSIKQLLVDRNLHEDLLLARIAQYQQLLHSQNKFNLCDGIMINFNQTKYERPINIVIKRYILEKYMQAQYIVSQDEMVKI